MKSGEIITSSGAYTYGYSDWGATYVAGINFHDLKDPSSIGFYQGYSKREPDNRFDPDAVSLYTNDGKFAGYIPSKNAKNGYGKERNRQYQIVSCGEDSIRWIGYVYPTRRTDVGYTTCADIIFYRNGLKQSLLRRDINQYFLQNEFPPIPRKIKLY